jgi:hypothetical protein
MTTDIERIAAARAAFADLRPRVEAGEPWPLAAAFGTEPEASWGPREVLAHVEEMLPYWLGELERVVDGPRGVAFGRVAEDTSRIGLIERGRMLPLRVLFDRIDAGLATWAARCANLTDAERAAVGTHPSAGEMTVAAMPERFIIAHVEGHIAQLEEILAA